MAIKSVNANDLIGKKVKVYWNSRKKCYSVIIKGKVAHHTRFLTMANAAVNISKSAYARVQRTGHKTVYATIAGNVTSIDSQKQSCSSKVCIARLSKTAPRFEAKNPHNQQTVWVPFTSAEAVIMQVTDRKPSVTVLNPV